MNNDACVDYEGEYNRLLELVEKQRYEIVDCKTKLDELHKDNIRMRAQLDMVYLIFGGNK